MTIFTIGGSAVGGILAFWGCPFPPRCPHILTHLFLTMALGDRYYYPGFSKEGSEQDLPTGTQLVRTELRFHPPCFHTNVFCLMSWL